MKFSYKREDPNLYAALILIMLTYVMGFIVKSELIVHMAFASAIGFGLAVMIVKQKCNN